MDLGLVHAVNIGKISLEEAQKKEKEKGATTPKPSKAAAKSDKTATPAGK